MLVLKGLKFWNYMKHQLKENVVICSGTYNNSFSVLFAKKGFINYIWRLTMSFQSIKPKLYIVRINLLFYCTSSSAPLTPFHGLVCCCWSWENTNSDKHKGKIIHSLICSNHWQRIFEKKSNITSLFCAAGHPAW